MPLQLTDAGLEIQSLTEIREEYNAALRAAYGNSLRVDDGSRAGKLAGIWSEREAIIQEGLEAVYHSNDPDAATGQAFTAIAALTGTNQNAADESACPVVLTGDDGTVIAAGSEASVVGTGDRFSLDESATLALADDHATDAVYAVGDTVWDGEVDNPTFPARIYRCIVGGMSGGGDGPGDLGATGDDIVDGAVHWAYCGEGVAFADGAMTALETGPTVAAAGDLAVIETSIPGWLSVRNLVSATPGSDLETIEDLRARREDELARAGTSVVDAIRADILALDGVTACTVFHNVTDVTDADGVPPHSVECLVKGGVDQDLYDAMLAFVAAGIRTHGTQTGTATDSQGFTHSVSFSRPTEIAIWVIINLLVGDDYPEDGDDQVAETIVDWGGVQKTGKNAVAAQVGAQAFTITDVLDTTSVLIGTADPPTASTTVQISTREQATYSTSRITVNSTPSTP